MKKLSKIGYDLSDVSIVQTSISPIRHRSECNPFRTIANKEMYPVIVSPMASVTDESNYKIWLENKFMCVIPRSVDVNTRLKLMYETFASFSLEESETILPYINNENKEFYICIDIAHGTMAPLYDVCKKLKKLYGNKIIIMTGNIATPEAYSFYVDAGIDYVRCFIGAGSRCTTACNVSVFYPKATLLDELNQERIKWENNHDCEAPTKLIADGGISNFDDIQKCLGLGADFVMCGNIFAKSEEACGDVFYMDPNNPNNRYTKPQYNAAIKYLKNILQQSKEETEIEESKTELNYLSTFKLYREYFGMSCKIAQKITGGDGNKTAEGISRPIPVEYPIAKWTDNMQSYLRSTMSYAGCYDLDEFKNNCEFIISFSGDRAYRK